MVFHEQRRRFIRAATTCASTFESARPGRGIFIINFTFTEKESIVGMNMAMVHLSRVQRRVASCCMLARTRTAPVRALGTRLLCDLRIHRAERTQCTMNRGATTHTCFSRLPETETQSQDVSEERGRVDCPVDVEDMAEERGSCRGCTRLLQSSSNEKRRRLFRVRPVRRSGVRSVCVTTPHTPRPTHRTASGSCENTSASSIAIWAH